MMEVRAGRGRWGKRSSGVYISRVIDAQSFAEMSGKESERAGVGKEMEDIKQEQKAAGHGN